MQIFPGLSSLILTLFRKILFLWVRTDVSGNNAESLGLDPDKPVCYVSSTAHSPAGWCCSRKP